MLHLRAIQISPDEDPSIVDITNKVAPDVSIGYFLTDHFALDLLLTVPQKHDLYLGSDRIGDFKQLPPTLFAQWHFNPEGTWRPYVGAGLNYMFISDENLGGIKLDDSVGPAAQIGMDVALKGNWTMSFDVKKIWAKTTASVGGTSILDADVDPWVLGIGFGYKFGKPLRPSLLPEGQPQGADDDRLAGAGLPGQGDQPAGELQVEPLDDRDVADSQLAQHP